MYESHSCTFKYLENFTDSEVKCYYERIVKLDTYKFPTHTQAPSETPIFSQCKHQNVLGTIKH